MYLSENRKSGIWARRRLNWPLTTGMVILSLNLLGGTILKATETAAIPIPAIPGVPASGTYQVRVNGVAVPVNDESYFDFHTAFFSMGKPVTVDVEFAEGVSYQSIHPLRHGIKPERNGKTISFTLEKPLKLVIKTKGPKDTKPLAVCATPMEADIPAAGDSGVLYFGPGIHEPGVIEPASGQTVYFAPGALVKGRIAVSNATNVTIRGRGTLDTRGYSIRGKGTKGVGVLVERSRNVHIEGIGIRGGTNWMTLFLLTNTASINHVSLLGKSVNTDGIDIDGVQDFTVRNCFIRCEDDGFGWHAINAKANGEPPTRNCLAENCVIWNTHAGNGLRIGASMETQFFENITFRNIDVLKHAGAGIYSDHSDWATCRNIRFENFTIESPGKRKEAIKIFIKKTRYSSKAGRDERGRYDGLEFINVAVPAGTSITLNGCDADHQIKNVLFRNSRRGDEPIDGPEDIKTNKFVSNVIFKTDNE